jgi:pimeloyl-ACP methyl ester carboxylesterase
MEKTFIENRKGEKISVLVGRKDNQKGLVFVMHGLGGFKEQEHIETIASAFQEKGFTVVRFDTTNSFGESDGKYEDATITNYYEDLEDVIKWAGGEKWYQEPFVLAGHSLGGVCTCLYSEKYPEKILALAPISTVVSGRLSVEAGKRNDADGLKKWEDTGWREDESFSKPGVLKRLPWSHMVDRLKYDLIPNVAKLNMPVLLIVGENDKSTPKDHQVILFKALPGPKEIHIIKNAPHTFRSKEHLAEVRNILGTWIDTFHK